jgi:hypothetical protein
VVRLIRSKGVGVFFITQNPADIPDTVLGQLGNRIQHALRAFTPKQQKAIKQAAETYRENPKFEVDEVITELGVGEALVSTLEGKGTPSIVERALIRPPTSRLGPASADAKRMELMADEVGAKYDKTDDRESAYEILQKRAEKAAEQAAKVQEEAAKAKPKKSSSRQSVGEAAVKSIVRSVASSVGRAIAKEIINGKLLRGVLGGLKR